MRTTALPLATDHRNHRAGAVLSAAPVTQTPRSRNPGKSSPSETPTQSVYSDLRGLGHGERFLRRKPLSIPTRIAYMPYDNPLSDYLGGIVWHRRGVGVNAKMRHAYDLPNSVTGHCSSATNNFHVRVKLLGWFKASGAVRGTGPTLGGTRGSILISYSYRR